MYVPPSVIANSAAASSAAAMAGRESLRWANPSGSGRSFTAAMVTWRRRGERFDGDDDDHNDERRRRAGEIGTAAAREASGAGVGERRGAQRVFAGRGVAVVVVRRG